MNFTQRPAIWFLAIRTNSGTDIFTKRLVEGLRSRDVKAEITWLPHRAEYAPWTVTKPRPPSWANIAHVNTWLPKQFLSTTLPIVATLHSCVHDPALTLYKSRAQTLYHRHRIYGIEADILRIADKVVAVSRYTAGQTSITFGRNDITVIPNAINLSGPFQPINRRTPHRPFRLLYAGNWSQLKGVGLLAPIMENLGAGFELRYTADRNNSHNRYIHPANSRCLGRISDESKMAVIYQDSDALLFPSRLEGFGLVALEAQACGLPVIATQSSAIPEVVENGVTGLLCPQDDIQAFADSARRLASSPNLWNEMKRDARMLTERRFGFETMIDHYLEIYEAALHAKTSTSPR